MTAALFSSRTIDPASYEHYFADTIALIDERLNRCLQRTRYEAPDYADGLWEAMRYGVLNGGKRIRSVLAIETCLACGGHPESVLPTACAIELIHAQSLIHDDLPCMDNDDMRRGKPSVHKAFGEATAVLAGDALIAFAFGLIAHETPLVLPVTPDLLLGLVADFSRVTSVKGLVNGQFVDILYEGKPCKPDVLQYIHTYKTGALFQFAMRAGARLAGVTPDVSERFAALGQTLGFAFQIVDDLLDIGSTPETLGKTPGKDKAQQKATYPALFGEAESHAKVQQLTQEALDLLQSFQGQWAIWKPERLVALVMFLAQRVY